MQITFLKLLNEVKDYLLTTREIVIRTNLLSITLVGICIGYLLCAYFSSMNKGKQKRNYPKSRDIIKKIKTIGPKRIIRMLMDLTINRVQHLSGIPQDGTGMKLNAAGNRQTTQRNKKTPRM